LDETIDFIKNNPHLPYGKIKEKSDEMNKKLEPHLKAAALREQINETKKSFGNLDPISN